MNRLVAIAVLGLLVTSCATVRQDRPAVAVLGEARFSSELECMADCLDAADESCDACAERCLARTGEPVAFAR